jgi:hypothetical protein
MKPFMPFLLVPVLSLSGWGLSLQAMKQDALQLPAVMALDAPPALGVVIPAADSQGPVRVPVDVLLPQVSRPSEVTRAIAPQDLPRVSAILVEGQRKVAQVNGLALAIGESYGLYKIVAIENHRVQFDHPALRQKRWVNVLDR